MKLEKFLLDEWLETMTARPGAIEYHLASSTGPHWTLRELLALEPELEEELRDLELIYSRATGGSPLREALAEMLGAEPSQVQIVTGAAEGLLILSVLAAESGANVVVPEPCFPPTRALPQAFGLEVRSYRLRAESGFALDLDEVKRMVDGGTRFLLVNTPHNPTGAVLSREELTALHDLCASRGIPFVSDEVYSPIGQGTEVVSAAPLPHATVLGDLSKAFCLSGLRVGFLLERGDQRREEYLNARELFTVTNAPLEEALAALAVRRRETIFERARRVTRENLALLEDFFERHADVFGWVRPQGGMTAFPWLRASADARPFCVRLAESGVLVVPGDCFGAPAHFRIGYGANGPEDFANALDRVEAALPHALAKPRAEAAAAR
jgi:aspartate/methionine/tyrosine aminotransferase